VGGEQHRQVTVDTLLLSYFTYKEKLPHTLASKLQPVLSLMHCVKDSVNRLPLSRNTIARCLCASVIHHHARPFYPPPPPSHVYHQARHDNRGCPTR
jgi:hypothetical protein